MIMLVVSLIVLLGPVHMKQMDVLIAEIGEVPGNQRKGPVEVAKKWVTTTQGSSMAGSEESRSRYRLACALTIVSTHG